MKNIFVINPAAGKGSSRDIDELKKKIEISAKKLSVHASIYLTKSVGDGERFVKEICETAIISPDRLQKFRFFACGGDGTLGEVVNGAAAFDNAVVGCVPIGTGNDFVRNFPQHCNFDDISAQLMGEIQEVDLIRCSMWDTEESREVLPDRERYCINMLNIGFDCNVVDAAARLKKYPLIAGSLAYLLGVIIIAVKKQGANLKISITDTNTIRDGFSDNQAKGSGSDEGAAPATGPNTKERIISNGKILLVAIANGCFCGGGVKAVPKAAVDDGVIDVSIIQDIPRRRFPALFPKYSKGTHLDIKHVDKIVTYEKCTKITVTAGDDYMRMSMDGELTDLKKAVFTTVPKMIRFSVPFATKKPESVL